MLLGDQNIFISLPLENLRYLRAVLRKHGLAWVTCESASLTSPLMLLLVLRPNFTWQSLERPGVMESRGTSKPLLQLPWTCSSNMLEYFPWWQVPYLSGSPLFPDGRRDGTVSFTRWCLPPCYSHSLILVHYFGSSGCGDTTQVMHNPDLAFSLVLVFDWGRPWKAFPIHSGDEEAAIPGKCRILWAGTCFWREFS